MNKVLLSAAVLISGLLFLCPKVEAVDGCFWPTQGFTKYIQETECKPIYRLPDYILTEEDADLLLRVGVLEAGETDTEGIAKVIQVVLNRVFESYKFPNSISGVVYQLNQFSTASELATANITQEAEDALEAVCNGEYKDNEALYFESLPGIAWGDVHHYLFSYGGHDFYN